VPMQTPDDGAIIFRDLINCIGMSGREQVVPVREFVNRIGVSFIKSARSTSHNEVNANRW
jgi:hypothetical protein